MKNMPFLRPYKRKNNMKVVFSVVGTALVLFIVGMQPAFLTRIVMALSAPLHGMRNTLVANSGSFFSSFASSRKLSEENKVLQEEVMKLKIKSDLYDSLRREYSGTASASSSVAIVSHVLETPPFSPYDTLLIDRGSNDGVSVGDRVVFDETVGLGVVDAVSRGTARVRLFSSPGYEQAVRIGTHDFLAQAQGTGGGSFKIIVPKENTLVAGDLVLLPTGELLGVVRKVVERDADSFVQAQVRMPENIFELRVVSVLPQYATE